MTKIREDDTIAAISTPLGAGGIGIVRMSGPLALDILKKLFSPSAHHCRFKSHTLYHGIIRNPEQDQIVDEALCVFMKAPKTYTREDIVEIQCHAGYSILRQILELCIRHGARLAEPGEFTKRAFLNGRIDLIQAEAVLDLTSAQASGLSHMGARAVKGELSKRIRSIRKGLVGCLAALEVAIDYPEEDHEILDQADIKRILEKEVIEPLQTLIRAFDRSKIHRFGAGVLLVGRPNAGKSSLLNALSCEDKAIVTEIPGTTRDIVEARIEIGGACITLLDTAGIRHEPDPIEAMGIGKIRQLAPTANLFLWLLDISKDFNDSDEAVLDMIKSFDHIPVIIVFNKVDKIEIGHKALARRLLEKITAHHEKLVDTPYCLVSAKRHSGLDQLQKSICETLLGTEARIPDVAPNLRQKEILEKTLILSHQALQGLIGGLSPEIPAMDIRQALDHLSETTGEFVTEDVLEQIFSRFCLGK